MKSIVILISGRGSNMQAIIAAVANGLPVNIRAVISNRPDAVGLTTAKQHGIATHALDHKAFASRDAFDAALMQTIDAHAPDLVVLAGFMRVLTASFVNRYANRLVNIHPSLLPSFPGVHTHRQALDAGVKIHGTTVHLVTPELDHGPIIIQAAVPVLPEDTEATLAARVLTQEHKIYPLALRWLAEDKVKVGENGVVQIAGLRVLPDVDTLSLTAPLEK
jgi:phosphoribosylglycinamide formyltransferase 1